MLAASGCSFPGFTRTLRMLPGFAAAGASEFFIGLVAQFAPAIRNGQTEMAKHLQLLDFLAMLIGMQTV
ncbi:hypothetical protein [Bradyrhizobium sp. SZCCHNS3002]|uniref:hypothetical protein n=1 Tax=Bradyrhizobium sp. SZCCHNS3002 TaxID=3057310 RepID=UPI0028E5BD92|nr:hypothetical protein [Bradyrhizobium sp. SZCCHNS3002]